MTTTPRNCLFLLFFGCLLPGPLSLRAGIPAVNGPSNTGIYWCCGQKFDEGTAPGSLRRHMCAKHADSSPHACDKPGLGGNARQAEELWREQELRRFRDAITEMARQDALKAGDKARALKKESKKSLSAVEKDWSGDAVQLEGSTPQSLKEDDPYRPPAAGSKVVPKPKPKDLSDPCPACCDFGDSLARWRRLPSPITE